MSDGKAMKIDRLARVAGGVTGVSALHLETDRRFTFRGGEFFPMASTFKIAVAAAVLHRIARGELSLGQMLLVEDSMRLGPGGMASSFPHAGISLSIHNLMEAMLTQSDNTATDMLMHAVGGSSKVTAWLRSVAIMDQRVDRTTRQLLADFFALQPGETLEAAISRRPELEALGVLPNPAYDYDPRDTSTPDAMVQLLAAIHRREALAEVEAAVLLDVMSRCATGDQRMRGRLPEGTPVAHKTGTIGGSVNDVGVITLPDGSHLVLALFMKETTAPFPVREQAIAEITRALYDNFTTP